MYDVIDACKDDAALFSRQCNEAARDQVKNGSRMCIQCGSESKEWDGEPDQEKSVSKIDQIITDDLRQTVSWGAGRQNH